MYPDNVPVILVHGWNSHPGAWKHLIRELDAARIPYALFDYSKKSGRPLDEIAGDLGRFIAAWRNQSSWDGPVDIVCHSIGTCIARYLLEVSDGRQRQQRVRQLVGLGPPNNGSALAEIWFHPLHGPELIRKLTGVFVPRGYDPGSDAMVRDVRPGSEFMEQLRTSGTRPDIIYRIIVTANPGGNPEFFPLFAGKTWKLSVTQEFCQTLDGDGIVTHAESALPG
ncbi:MAG: alpha/beta fold hydrolase, partial [Methanomicrobiales archaeon]|nr:alpha/beta fold hydrolase [Methanomicrobiales archaeon]